MTITESRFLVEQQTNARNFYTKKTFKVQTGQTVETKYVNVSTSWTLWEKSLKLGCPRNTKDVMTREEIPRGSLLLSDLCIKILA